LKNTIRTLRNQLIFAFALLLCSTSTYSQSRDVTAFRGSDIGQQINAAYAALAPTGGRLHVPAKSDGGCYQYTSSILFNIPNKSVVVEGDSLQSTCLQYTGSGVAVQFDYGFNPAVFGAALKDLCLQGTAHQGTGLLIGGSTGAEGLLVENVRITGFGLGVTYDQKGWASRFDHTVIDDNVQNLYYPPNLIASGENVEFSHVVFLNTDTEFSNTDAYVANSIVIDAAGGGSPPDFNFVDCSFDGVQLVLTVGYINIVNPHFEGGLGRNALDWVVINGAYVNIVNPMFLQDFYNGSQPSQLIRATGGLTVLSGVKAYTNQVIPRLMLLQGTASALVLGEINVQNFTADIVKDTGATGYFAVHGDYGFNRPLRLSNNVGLWWENADASLANELFRVDAYNNLVVQNPGGGVNFWNHGESSAIVGISDNGLAIGPASISTSGDAVFKSVTTSEPVPSFNSQSQTIIRNRQAGEKKPDTTFSSLISFGIIPANSCRESGIPAVGATTATSVAPVWPALENGLTGIMYVPESGKVVVRLCNSTAGSVGTASHYFGAHLGN
jgi:hypothetical protein